MNIPLPELEPRLQRRYQQLVNEHLQPREPHAAGSRALPSVNQAFASTQAAWRFYSNQRVTLPDLAAPLLQQASQLLPQACRNYALVIHDWSELRYAAHTAKRDRRSLGKDRGYELASALNLRPAGAVEIAANLQAQLLVGETAIVLDRPAFPRVRQGKRQWLKGAALELRLIVGQLLMPDGRVEAQWCLLSNLEMAVRAPVLAEW